MKFVSKPKHYPLDDGLCYHRIGIRIGGHVFGMGFATGGGHGSFRLFTRLDKGTIWLWRFAVCRIRVENLADPQLFVEECGK